jgi:hypothetical protein
MADTTTIALASTAIVVGGQWAQDKPLTPRVIVAGGFLAFSLALMDAFSSDLARGFAILILVIAMLAYGVPIVERLGLIGGKNAS